ncbi:MAG: DUF2809 domain-containing protein [Patescibacteria group bacterium]|jgi:hypothetical protein
MQKRQVNELRTVFGVLAIISLLFGLLIFFFVHSGFLRNYGGDVVAVTFLYSLLRLTLSPKPKTAAGMVFAVAVFIEVLQALVSLPHSTVTTLTLGSTFDPLDLLAYFLTVLALYLLDNGLRASLAK